VASITFLAIIAPLQSGIQISGDGNGLRVKLDVPESEMGNAVELLAMRDKVLRVTVEVQEPDSRRASGHRARNDTG
jgi:hypothetical protein